MRARSAALLALVVSATATTAFAQSSANPNALNSMNERMSTQSQIRGVEQQQQFQNNQTQMQIQRNELFQPTPSGPAAVVPRAR